MEKPKNNLQNINVKFHWNDLGGSSSHKGRQKSLNFFHEHNVPLVLLLIIVMHYFYTNLKLKSTQKDLSTISQTHIFRFEFPANYA
jgi:hypothetical protein